MWFANTRSKNKTVNLRLFSKSIYFGKPFPAGRSVKYLSEIYSYSQETTTRIKFWEYEGETVIRSRWNISKYSPCYSNVWNFRLWDCIICLYTLIKMNGIFCSLSTSSLPFTDVWKTWASSQIANEWYDLPFFRIESVWPAIKDRIVNNYRYDPLS